ncbi:MULTISPECIES: hypothetical protein [Pseudofrankia]|uniref:hypothetical protein n=1 Tax=Pseudofrankia TaxID=2994363 RepID=UPI000234B9FE|nr:MULTISPECIES: hypothetical protein [Pseudofrankia]OHV40893.1 hypothetical protein BCD49_39150 [Pseudofrankia sp. EUN1h]
MSAAVLNIVIGLLTSVISGGAVWAWQRASGARVLRRKALFFGLERGGTCLVILNNKWDAPGSTSHHDVHAMIEVAVLASEAACPVSVQSSTGFRESNGNRTEFCIGGPESNSRTAGHVASQLPGVTVHPVHPTRADSAALTVGDQQFALDRGRREYALVAKFTPTGASRPVVLICGQTAISNRAAIHFLRQEFHAVSNAVGAIDRFCVMIRVDGSNTYGHQAAVLDRDVTAVAFAG